MVAQNANEAVGNANSYATCEKGQCLKYVRTWLEIPSQQASAIDAWNAAKHKHPDDKTPKRGAPCFYKGGQYGHIVLAVSNSDEPGRIRSTDVTSSNHVSTVDIDWCTQHWGYEYLGWTEDLNGVMIPWLGGDQPEESPWASGKVYVNKLEKGTQGSDSVARLTYRLRTHKEIPEDKKPKQKNNYQDDVVQAVKWWQRHNGWEDGNGNNMGNNQANKLFGDNYNVIEE